MYRPMKYGYSRFPIDLGIMLSQPLDWEISADTPLELADFPADIFLVVTDAHGQRRGIFLARTLDGRPIGTGHFYWIRPLDPRQFMLKHKLRVHNGPGAAGIHEKVPFTLAIFAILVYPVQNCSDKQAFSVFGGRRLGRFPLCFSLCKTHGWFQYVRGLSTPRSSTTSRWNTWQLRVWYGLVSDGIRGYGFYVGCAVTHTRLRVSGNYPSSVCLCRLTRAARTSFKRLPSSEGLRNQWFFWEKNSIQLTLLLSPQHRSRDQTATQLEPKNQDTPSTSPGLLRGGYGIPKKPQNNPTTQTTQQPIHLVNTGPLPRRIRQNAALMPKDQNRSRRARPPESP
jgi:hypothetical protein